MKCPKSEKNATLKMCRSCPHVCEIHSIKDELEGVICQPPRKKKEIEFIQIHPKTGKERTLYKSGLVTLGI